MGRRGWRLKNLRGCGRADVIEVELCASFPKKEHFVFCFVTEVDIQRGKCFLSDIQEGSVISMLYLIRRL